uniref:Uncharacterized protein n=1 Tax=Lactuca sativa TaxID=4236 RepID=A0A9R1WY67_LACSA|nr:hypothetical protein LSAT_V11C800409820 [Lactuca sativa]
MSSFHVFWPIVENPRRLWHLEQNLKAIIDFEGIVVQEEGGFWPKEEQGGRVLRFGDTESMFSGKVSDHSCFYPSNRMIRGPEVPMSVYLGKNVPQEAVGSTAWRGLAEEPAELADCVRVARRGYSLRTTRRLSCGPKGPGRKAMLCGSKDPGRKAILCGSKDPGRKAILCGSKDPGRKAMLCGPNGPGRMAYVRKGYFEKRDRQAGKKNARQQQIAVGIDGASSAAVGGCRWQWLRRRPAEVIGGWDDQKRPHNSPISVLKPNCEGNI